MLKISHTSDLHGIFIPQASSAEVIVATGDLFPNASRGNRAIEPAFQDRWIKQHIENYKRLLNGRPLIFIHGNHDFSQNFAEILTDNGMEIYDINDRRLEFRGFTFYGFPWIPYICGEWNYELTGTDLHNKVRELQDKLNDVDVLCCHSPPYGVLDSNYVIKDDDGNFDYSYGSRFGNQPLTDLICYKWDQITNPPRYVLCGHCHESKQTEERFDIFFSNAATTSRTIDLEPRQKENK